MAFCIRTAIALRLGAAAVFAASAVLPAAAQDFYAGKQMTLIVGSGVGGGYDLLGRLMARHLGHHIPGNPTIVVQNMPAAGSIAATNYISATAPRDGTALALIQRGMLLAKHLYPSGVRFEIEKLNWIGSLNSETAITVAWHDAPVQSTKDLFQKELIVGGIAGVDPETTPKLYNSLIGTKFKVVNGYTSTADIALAIERGELQGLGDWSLSSIKSMRPDWLRDHKITMLLQGALHNDPELKDLPNALDFIKDPSDRKVMELHFTQKTAARPVIAPPGVPPERIAILRSAFMALAKDQAFLSDAEKSKLEVGPISGEELDKIVALISATPPDIAARFAKAFGPPPQ